MGRTVESLVGDARAALNDAGLTQPEWTLADVVSARVVGAVRKRIVGELGWGSAAIRFVVVDRSLMWKLPQAGLPWRAGLSGWFLIRLGIDPRFGFQAEVFDVLVESLVDSTSLERREMLVRRIDREGWSDRQRSLPDPGVPAVVAVVSSPHAQGLSDFLSTIGDGCVVRVVEAPMAGDSARAVAASIRRASVGVALVIVLRGGGAASGMEWADDERVVEAVATCPVPVWTAIGHADDRHLVDAVAQLSFATPTQAAAELQRRVIQVGALAREAELEQRRLAAERMTSHVEADVSRRVRRAWIAAAAVVIVLGAIVIAVMVGAG